LPTPARFRRFQRAIAVLHRLPSPGTFQHRVHPPTSLTPLQSLPIPVLSVSARSQSPSVGFPPPSRHQPSESPTRRGSRPHLQRRPQGFSPSRRVPLHSALRAYFIPQPRPGFSLQGFVLRRSRNTSSVSLALVSLPVGPLPPVARVLQSPPRRLQGFHSASQSVALHRLLHPRRARSPPGIRLLQVLPSLGDENAFTSSPSIAFARSSFTLVLHAGVRRLAHLGLGCLPLSRSPTCSRFLTRRIHVACASCPRARLAQRDH